MNEQPLEPADLNAHQNPKRPERQFPFKTAGLMLLVLLAGLGVIRHFANREPPPPPPLPEPTATPTPAPPPTPIPTPDPHETAAEAMRQATAAYEAGDAGTATEALERVLRIFPDHEAARELLPRARVADQTHGALKEAQQLKTENPDMAWLRIDRAFEQDADFPGVRDLHREIASMLRAEQAGVHAENARRLEAEEKWADAEAQWDYARRFGGDTAETTAGLARTAEYRRLESRLRLEIEHPERPAADELARSLTPAARAELPPGLRSLAETFLDTHRLQHTPVTVRLTSDAETEVRILRVRNFAPFVETRIALPPGDYTATGSRLGHRDVRVPFTVRPGAEKVEIDIRATEPIF